MKKRFFWHCSLLLALVGVASAVFACRKKNDPLENVEGSAGMVFKVISQKTGEPLKGIRIVSEATHRVDTTGMAENASRWKWLPGGETDENGECHANLIYERHKKGPYVFFYDPAKAYQSKDTVLDDLRKRTINIKLDTLILEP